MLSSQIRVEKNHLKTKKNSAPILSLSTFILNGQYKIIFSTLRSKIWEVTFIEIFFLLLSTEFSCVILSTLNWGDIMAHGNFPKEIFQTNMRWEWESQDIHSFLCIGNSPLFSSLKRSETNIPIMFYTHTHSFCVGT